MKPILILLEKKQARSAKKNTHAYPQYYPSAKRKPTMRIVGWVKVREPKVHDPPARKANSYAEFNRPNESYQLSNRRIRARACTRKGIRHYLAQLIFSLYGKMKTTIQGAGGCIGSLSDSESNTR